jgi:hypothetical protein
MGDDVCCFGNVSGEDVVNVWFVCFTHRYDK